MDSSLRKPLQGVMNIIRFNWHYYLVSIFVALLVLIFSRFFFIAIPAATILAILITVPIIVSLSVSAYIYDFSGLYEFSWLDDPGNNDEGRIINIHAGFDETSQLLKNRFGKADFFVVDFYDASKHTEVSIKRARKVYPSFPGTRQIATDHLPFNDCSTDRIFNIFSAHEIRKDDERIVFFKELHRILKPEGKIVVTEHLRDMANFLAYNFGFLHFHSRTSWLKTFQAANLMIIKEIKTTPFITTFILEKNGTTS